MYIIGGGEFELSKFAPAGPLKTACKDTDKISTIIKKKKTGIKVRGPQNLKNPNSRAALVSQNVKIAILTPGQSFGDDDVVSDVPYKATLTCV